MDGAGFVSFGVMADIVFFSFLYFSLSLMKELYTMPGRTQG